MAGPLAAAIPANALAATATPILSFRSEQVMRIALARLDQPLHAKAGYLKSPKRCGTRVSCALPILTPTYCGFRLSGIGKGFPLRKICDSWSLGLIRTEGTTMGIPYSNDLRSRVLAAVDGGVPVRQVAALLRVSVSYIYKAS